MSTDVVVLERLDRLVAQVDRIVASSEEVLTIEQTAVRLRLSVDQVKRKMKRGDLPRGVVWFERPGLPPYFAWSRVCEFLFGSPHPNTLEGVSPPGDEEDELLPSWRERGR